MYSSKDFEKLCFLYKTEGEPKGVSINSFCVLNMVPTCMWMNLVALPNIVLACVFYKDVKSNYAKANINENIIFRYNSVFLFDFTIIF